jgi:hypothetical protein
MWVHLALNATAVVAVGRDTMAGLPSGRFADVDIPTWMSASFASGGFAAELGLAALGEEGLEAGLVVLAGEDAELVVFGVELEALFEELELHAANATAPAPAAPAARTERRVTVESMRIEESSGSGERCRLRTRGSRLIGSPEPNLAAVRDTTSEARRSHVVVHATRTSGGRAVVSSSRRPARRSSSTPVAA